MDRGLRVREAKAVILYFVPIDPEAARLDYRTMREVAAEMQTPLSKVQQLIINARKKWPGLDNLRQRPDRVPRFKPNSQFSEGMQNFLRYSL